MSTRDAPPSQQHLVASNQSSAQTAPSTLDSQGRPARKRSLVDISQDPQQTSNLSQQVEGDRSDSKRRSPRREMGNAARRPSEESNRRARNPAAPGASNRTPTDSNSPKSKQKKSGVSRFFSILNCCRAPDTSSATDEGPPEATRKVQLDRPSQSTQNTPSSKLELAQTDPATTGMRDQTGNSQGLPNTAVTTPVPPRTENQPTEKSVPVATRDLAASSGQDQISAEKPLPSSPSIIATQGLNAPNTQSPLQPNHPTVQLSPPTPVSPAEEQVISDRTPQQAKKDEDIEMSDIPPSLPLAGSDVSATTREDSGQVITQAEHPRVGLPPAPPASERQGLGGANEGQQGAATESTSTSALTEGKQWLLPAVRPEHKGRKCLVLDLDETLVHSSFKVRSPSPFTHGFGSLTDFCQILHQADFTIPVEIEGQYHNVYVIKRPGVDQFMKRVGELYEVVVFTASVAKVCWP